jgi:hypothetical protein
MLSVRREEIPETQKCRSSWPHPTKYTIIGKDNHIFFPLKQQIAKD